MKKLCGVEPQIFLGAQNPQLQKGRVARGRTADFVDTISRALSKSPVLAPIVALTAVLILRERIVYLRSFYPLLLRGIGVTIASSARGLSFPPGRGASVILPSWLICLLLSVPLLSIAVLESSSFIEVLRGGLKFISRNLRRYFSLTLAVIGYTALPVILYSILGLFIHPFGIADIVVDTIATSLWIVTGMVGFVALHKFICDYH